MKTLLGLALAFTFSVGCGATAPEHQQQAVNGPASQEQTHMALSDARCGNGILECGEECDDNNSDNNDGCSESCSTEKQPPSNDDPTPDPTPDPGPLPEPSCGNGILETGEACDDGNNTCGDGCDYECNLEGLSQL